MALTVTQKGRDNVIGTRKMIVLDITFDDSYPTGGEALDLTTYVGTIESVMIEQKGGYQFEYDRTNKKVKVFNTIMDVVDSNLVGNANDLGTELTANRATEVPNTEDLSTVSTTLVVTGTRS
jgi:hypothetical protein